MKLKTKDKIVITALKLFNENGSKAISTNHIAEAAGISPGNLYYYFKNKKEIIRILFSMMVEKYEQCCPVCPEDPDPSLHLLCKDFETILQVQWEFRFIETEIVILTEEDDWLKEQFQEITQKKQEEFGLFIQSLIEADKMVPIDEFVMKGLVQNLWIISTFWQSYLRMTKRKLSKSRLKEGIQQIVLLFHPYLTEPEEFSEYLP